MYLGLHDSIRNYCQILTKFESSGQIFEKFSNIKFHENPLCGSRVIPFGMDTLTDMTKLIGVFRSSANATGSGNGAGIKQKMGGTAERHA